MRWFILGLSDNIRSSVDRIEERWIVQFYKYRQDRLCPVKLLMFVGTISFYFVSFLFFLSQNS